jgi:hypothetical protein
MGGSKRNADGLPWAKAEPPFKLHKRGVKRLKALSRAQKCAAA